MPTSSASPSTTKSATSTFPAGRPTYPPAPPATASASPLAPIDNFITEFLPDVARHIHVRIVLVQRIINQVAKTEGGPGGP